MDTKIAMPQPYQFEIGSLYEARCSSEITEEITYVPEDTNIIDHILVSSNTPEWEYCVRFSPRFEPDLEILQLCNDDILPTDAMPEFEVIYGEGAKFDCHDSVKERLGIEEPTPEAMKEKGYVIGMRRGDPLHQELVIEQVFPRGL